MYRYHKNDNPYSYSYSYDISIIYNSTKKEKNKYIGNIQLNT
jgi:hypothetical protein